MPSVLARVLTEPARARLGRLLAGGAAAAGFGTERWTPKRIAVLIRREFGVRHHPRHLERPLRVQMALSESAQGEFRHGRVTASKLSCVLLLTTVVAGGAQRC